MNVVFLHKEGKSPSDIQEAFPALSQAQVYAALAYYYDNPDEIEADLRADETAADRYEQERAKDLARGPAK